MAIGTLKSTTNFANKYEFAKSILKNNPLYQESHWLAAAKGNSNIDLDMYIASLNNSDNINIDNLYKDYNYEYGDNQTQMAALYNEAFKDQFLSSTRTQERYKYDNNGNIIKKDGKPVTEKYEISEYEYYKSIIKQQNDYKQSQWLEAQELERKNSMNGFVKMLADVSAIPLNLLSGVGSVVDGVVDTASSIANAASSAIKGGDFIETYVKSLADSDYRPFDEFQKWITDFESRYTNLRDLNGNYTNLGKYIGGISLTVGQMLPSVLIGKLGGGIAGKIGGTAGKVVAKSSSIASQVVYYGSMSTNNIRDMYNKFAAGNVSVPTAQILTNAALKSTFEFGVEKILGKILGGTAIDDVVFGRSSAKAYSKTSSSLTSAGISRILKDAGQEGLEEVLQETSSFFVDRAFSIVANENFGEITNLTWQSLMDSFIIGAIVSIGGSAFDILRTSGKTMRGLGEGGKIAAWEHGLNLQSFVQNYDAVIKANEKANKSFTNLKNANKIDKQIDKQAKVTSAAMTEMYASYRMLSSIYGEIGEARFKAANEILNKITSDIERGKFDLTYAKSQADEVYNSILGERTLSKEFANKLKKDIEDANITEIVEEAIVGEDVSERLDSGLKESLSDVLKQVEERNSKSDKKIKKLVVTKDGNRPVSVKDKDGNLIVAVPLNLLTNSDFEVTETFLAEQDIVQQVLSSTGTFAIEIDEILSKFKESTGLENATREDAVWSLMFDENCTLFTICLKHAKIDMQAFLQKIVITLESYRKDKLDDLRYRRTLNKIRRNMSKALFNYLVDYSDVSYDARIFSDKQIETLERMRYTVSIGVRLLQGGITKDDMYVLERRIQNSNLSQSEKDVLLKNVISSSAETRSKVLKRLDYVYNSTLYGKYDDVHYLKETNVARTVFNNWLISLNLDYTNWLNEYDNLSYEQIVQSRKEQFAFYCNDAVKLELNDDGKLYPVSNYSVAEESYRGYLDVQESNKNKVMSLRTYSKENLTKSLLNESLPKYYSDSITINDVIVQPEYLSDFHKNAITKQYGNLTSHNVFLYLREYFIKNYKTISLSMTDTGTFCYVECGSMSKIVSENDIALIKSKLKAGETLTVNELEFLNNSFSKKVKDLVKDVKIKLLPKASAYAKSNPNTLAFYAARSRYIDVNSEATSTILLDNPQENEFSYKDDTIYISESILNDDDLSFTFLHELQHAVQARYRLNAGFSITSLKDLFTRDSHKVTKILNDLREHVPGLFRENLTLEQEIEIASEFIYNCSGEFQAFGMDRSNLIRFYPMLFNDGILTMPWGTVYKIFDGEVANGIRIEAFESKDNVYEISLSNLTKNYTIDDFKSKPRSLFIMPDGSIRTFEQDEHHYELISKITNNFTSEGYSNYFDRVPQISVQREGSKYYISVRISSSMSRSSMYSVLEIMDFLYSRHIEFDLGSIYYEDVDPFDVTVFSDEAENSDELIKLYSKEKASRRRTLPYLTYSYERKKDTIVTETQPAKTPKKRYVGQKEAKGTPLEKFTKQYSKTQMDPELKTFILSTSKIKVTKTLQNKIDNGTLVTADVMDYFRTTDLKDMDDATFKAINDAFFHNKVIKTKEDLQYYLDNTPSYYATRVIIRGSGNEALLLNENPDITKSLVDKMKSMPKSSEAGKLYDKLYKRFYYKGKDSDPTSIDVNEKYLKWLWMEHYDGSLQQAGRIANIVRYAAINGWNITGEVKTRSLEDTVVDDVTLADTIEDKSALQDMMDIVLNSDRNAKEASLKFKLSKKMFQLIAEKYGRSEEAAKSALKTKRIIDELTMDQLNEVAIRQMLSDVLGLKFDTLENKSVDEALSKVERTSWSIVNNINSNIRSIKSKLSPREVKLFVKYNADLFTDELKLRPEIYKVPNTKGRLVYKDSSELMKLWDRIRDLKDDVIQGAYESKSRLNQHIKFKKAMIELNEVTLKSLEKPVQKAKDVKTVTIEVADDVITVDTTKPIPRALERILDFEFSKVVKSRTQYLTNDDDYHFQTNLKTFLSNNAEHLESLTQQDVDDIIDYYTNSEILKSNMSESKYRLYNAVQLYMSVYLLKGNKLGWFTLSEEQYKALEKRTEVTVSVAAQELADWKAAMKMLKPEEVLINSLARSAGIEFSAEDVESLSKALFSGDIKQIQEAKKNAYLNASSKYEGRKSSFWDKLFQFERMAMLSGPGTWVRNIVSNTTIGGVYIKDRQIAKGLLDQAESVGNSAAKLIERLFPKKKWQREKQYKISGTVVTSEVKNFIDNNLIKSGLLNELIDGLSKYDVRKSKSQSGNENLTDMVTRSIATKIFYNNSSSNKYLDKTYKFIFKMLSDDKYVTRNMLKYLGKMLVEDKTDLTQGLTSQVTNTIAEAYTLAAQDYMHKSNVWNKIDGAIRNKTSPAIYFAYKQFFPFANTSWNWFVEGLNYTPLGLINSIVKFAKLESTIVKLDDARQKGETVISSRFAEYTVKRNIGKGVIGTIGTVIGMLMSAFGVVKLDENDDKYKITVGDTSVDITGLFGTQGIFIGMSTTQSIVDAVQGKDFDLLDVISRALDTMLVDSTFADVWTTIRYNPSLGNYVTMLPMKVLDSCVPNFFKTLTSVANVYKVKYNQGVLGKIEKLIVDTVPGLAYAFPHVIDVYTGEEQIMYKAPFITNLVNKLSPLKVKPMNVTYTERSAVNLGVNKTMLTGRYTIDNEEVILNASDVQQLNIYYGELNKKDLAELTSNKMSYKVRNEDGTYSKLRYSQMTETQKRAAFEQIMSKNSSYAKIRILTSQGYYYYASDSEYDALRKLGYLHNVYKETNKTKGFVKIK